MKIRPRGKSWQLDLGKVNGKREQLSFPTEALAVAEMTRRLAERAKVGELADELSAAERVKVVELRAQLMAVNATLSEAVEFFLKHAKPRRGVKNMWSFVRDFLDAMRARKGISGGYVKQLKCACSSLMRYVGEDVPACEVDAATVMRWLAGNGWRGKTCNGYLGAVAALYAWGMKEGYVTMNPAKGVEKFSEDDGGDDGDIAFLGVQQCRALLERAARVPGTPLEEDFRDCLGYVVIGLFCGLRPDRELGQMPVSDIRLDSRVVIVTKGRAKTRARRAVALSENAVEWLRLWLMDEQVKRRVVDGIEMLVPGNWKAKWKRLRVEAGLFEGWPHDALRHTFASFHLAMHEDEAALQIQMGHESARMIHANYKGLATKADAVAFWALRPLRPAGAKR